MMLQGMTARYLIHGCYRVKSANTILVHAAAGGVGLIACQWAKHLGAKGNLHKSRNHAYSLPQSTIKKNKKPRCA